jgi:hypothetical protein
VVTRESVEDWSFTDEVEEILMETRTRNDAGVFEPPILEERARLAALCGDGEAASEGLRRADAAYAEIGATGHTERLAQGLGA